MGNGLNKLVFQPPVPSYGNDPNLLWLQTSKRELIPAFHVFRSASRQTILFSHGNAEDLGMIVNYFRELAQAWDVNIFAYEYTGYGMSSGVPNEANVYADAEAAYEYLTKRFKVPWQQIVLYGRSLGTGACVHIASKFPVRGVILQSGLLSIHRVGLNLRLTLPGDMFCNIDKIAKVKCPVFVIHGVKDEIVPFSHGIQLYNACPSAVTPYWLEDAGHNNVELTGQTEFIENVSRFLKFLELNSVGTPAERLPKFELHKDHSAFLRHFVGTAPSPERSQSAIKRRGLRAVKPRKSKNPPQEMSSLHASMKETKKHSMLQPPLLVANENFYSCPNPCPIRPNPCPMSTQAGVSGRFPDQMPSLRTPKKLPARCTICESRSKCRCLSEIRQLRSTTAPVCATSGRPPEEPRPPIIFYQEGAKHVGSSDKERRRITVEKKKMSQTNSYRHETRNSFDVLPTEKRKRVVSHRI